MIERVPLPFQAPPFEIERPGPAWLLDADGEVLLRCACGYLLGSPTAHTIAADGAMDHSVMHEPGTGWTEEQRRCSWHVFVRLEGWVDGPLGRGALKYAHRKQAAPQAPRTA